MERELTDLPPEILRRIAGHANHTGRHALRFTSLARHIDRPVAPEETVAAMLRHAGLRVHDGIRGVFVMCRQLPGPGMLGVGIVPLRASILYQARADGRFNVVYQTFQGHQHVYENLSVAAAVALLHTCACVPTQAWFATTNPHPDFFGLRRF